MVIDVILLMIVIDYRNEQNNCLDILFVVGLDKK